MPMYACADNNENIGKFTRFSLSNIDKEKGCHAHDLRYDLFAVGSVLRTEKVINPNQPLLLLHSISCCSGAY